MYDILLLKKKHSVHKDENLCVNLFLNNALTYLYLSPLMK